MKRMIMTLSVLLLLAGMASAQVTPLEGTPKYVFFMIGDGMAPVQIHAAEAYLNTLEQGTTEGPRDVRANLMSFTSELPFSGMSTTYDYGVLITDSASAGTALACGKKTYSGVVSVDPETKTIPYKTLAELADELGMKVGILSSVSLDHATPAVFYAHEATRNNYGNIAYQGATNDLVDFFGGGSFRADKWKDPNPMWPTFEANGFTVVQTLADLQALPAGTRCVAASKVTQDSFAMHYEIDRINGNANGEWSLAEVTAEAIRMLDNENGFFMMVEGGKIDWTCHANDALTSIYDTLAFDDACSEVIEFAKQHPGECLIVVTADHETGGLTQGWAGTAYASAYETLAGQTMSFQAFGDVLDGYTPAEGVENLVDDAVMLTNIENAFGLVYAELTDYQKEQLEAAYDRQITDEVATSAEEDALLYSYYNPLAVACTHLTNARAGIGWTSYSHTAVPVLVMANDASFSGYYDNTDVAKKIAAVMGGTLD